MTEHGFSRAGRVADQIQRDLAYLIQREVKDPRLARTTVSAVRVSKDFATADIYVTFLGVESADEVKPLLAALNKAAGFLRSQLAKGLSLRTVPSLRFHFDTLLEQSLKLSAMIEQAVRQDRRTDSDAAKPDE
jgi:ribosome-binding factor A